MKPSIRNILFNKKDNLKTVLDLQSSKSNGGGLPYNSPLTTNWKDLSRKNNDATLTSFAGTRLSGLRNIDNRVLRLSNLLGRNGNFETDSNSDGLGNGLSETNLLSKTMSSNEQYIVANTTSGEHKTEFNFNTPVNIGDKYYACGYFKTTKGKARCTLYTHYYQNLI